MLYGKKIIIGVTGGIAAYKIPSLVRLLVKAGAEVQVVMTRDAATFVTPHTLSVVSGRPVITDFFNDDFRWNSHVELGLWADLLLIAPLTANTLSAMASGACNNVLLAMYLSMRGVTVVAPAMDLDMWRHPSVQTNVNKLKDTNVTVLQPETGPLASGLSGEGRMPEPEHLFAFLRSFLDRGRLKGLNALVNAGPTYEAIDAVRFIGNRSSGKMGVALAEALAKEGASVTLVLGPSQIRPNGVASLVEVESSDEMYAAMMERFDGADLVICAAAVADYKPLETIAGKMKKKGEAITLRLSPTHDILAELGKRKTRQLLVGFALETENLVENAREKLRKKNLDIIVANAANEPGSGFSADTNRVVILDRHNKVVNFELKPKQDVASDIVAYIADFRG